MCSCGKNEKKNLNEAIRQIKILCDKPETHKYPFFFIIGAGVSSPSVPLASQIIEECKKKIPDFKESGTEDRADQYSYWIEMALPSKEKRREYFTELISDKPIPHAQLRLAHLLSRKKIANIVITPNFDDLLSRALQLFETDHIIFDHPKTIDRFDPARKEIQIIHVHGNYRFYDLDNLKGEIEEKARLKENEISMVEKVSSIMSQYSPIIIGYSGWETDIIMTALKRSLNVTSKNNIYWFCYREEHCESLPDFIKNHPDVICVVPEKPKPTKVESPEPGRFDASGNISYEKEPGEDDTRSPTLPAQRVFDALNAGFGCGVPELTKDPLEFFIKKLEKAFLKKSGESDILQSGEQDLYSIEMVIQKILQAKKCLESKKCDEYSEEALEKIFDAVRKSDYKAALNIPEELDLSKINENQLKSFISKETIALLNLNVAPPEKIRILNKFIRRLDGYDTGMLNQVILQGLKLMADAQDESGKLKEAVATYDQVISRSGEPEDAETQVLVANALFRKGVVLGKIGATEEETEVYDEITGRFEDSENKVIQVNVARALINKGIALEKIKRKEEDAYRVYGETTRPGVLPAGSGVAGAARVTVNDFDYRFSGHERAERSAPVMSGISVNDYNFGRFGQEKDAIDVYDEIIEKFGRSKNPELREPVARAYVNKGLALEITNRIEDAIGVYDEIIDKFGNSEDTDIQLQVAMGLFNKGVALGKMNREKDAIKIYDEITDRFGNSENPLIRVNIAKALFNKAIALGIMNRKKDEIKVYDEIKARFGESENPELKEPVARALVNKGWILSELNREEDAIGVYDEITDRYGNSEETDIQLQVAMALFNKGLSLEKINRKGDAIGVYDELTDKFGNSKETKIQIHVAKALINKGVVLEGFEHEDDALRVYDDIIERFGKSKNPQLKEKVVKAHHNKDGLILK